MPTYAETTKIIESRLESLWTNTPVAYQNVPPLNYDLADNPPLVEGTIPYILTKILYGNTQNMEIQKSPSRRTFGNLVVDLYSKKDGGSAENQTNMDALSNLFEFQVVSGVTFKELVTMQDRTHGGWFVTPVMIRFFFDR